MGILWLIIFNQGAQIETSLMDVRIIGGQKSSLLSRDPVSPIWLIVSGLSY